MTRSLRPVFLLWPMLLLCIGIPAFSDDGDFHRPPGTEPPTIEEQIRMIDKKIRRTEIKAKREENPERRALLDKMMVNLEVVKKYKTKSLHGEKLSPEDRKAMQEANQNYQELQNAFRGLKQTTVASTDKQEPKAAQRRAKGPDTYETPSGFKVRLQMPE